jgi:uncharacterized protein YxjI
MKAGEGFNPHHPLEIAAKINITATKSIRGSRCDGQDGLPNHDNVTYCERRNSMRYVMKQNLFCWGDDFTIKDDQGQDVFFVDGRAFSIGDKLSFQDMAGNELAFIRQKLLSWGPTYEIYRGSELAAIVKKSLFTFFHCKFTVDVPGPDDLEAEGDFIDHEYRFARDGRTVATVSKQWFSWTDTYGVEIADGEDDVLILASTVVIDMVCHGDQKGGRH